MSPLRYKKSVERTYFNPLADIRMGANRVPHWEQSAATCFVTIRLADSLPAGLLGRWSEERALWLEAHPQPWPREVEQEYHRRFSGAVERWLDAGHGECPLRRIEVRAVIAEVVARFDRDRYWQHAWVLMPNHAHFLFSLQGEAALPALVKVWKGASSRAAGRILGKSGAFWQKDYFDRLVRDEQHFANCARYIRRNPAKARLRPGEYTLWISEEVRPMIEEP